MMNTEQVKQRANDILTMIRNRKPLTEEQKAKAIKLPNVMFAGVSDRDVKHIMKTVEVDNE